MTMRWIPMARLLGVLALGGAATTALPAGAAPPKKGAKAPKPPPFDSKGAAEKLMSTDPQTILAGLKIVRMGGKEAAPVAPLVERLLARGLPNDLAKVAVEAAGDLQMASMSGAIRPYIRHRDPEIRRAAVNAILKTKGPDATKALREALADSDGRVRGTAASGLGSLGARDAIPDLYAALERKVHEAAAAIGQLCTPDECEKFAERTGKIPFDVMTSGYDQILFRTGGDVTDDQKIRLVGRIRELGTGEANRYLKDVASRWTGTAKVKASIEQAVSATQGAPGSGPPAGEGGGS
jgi:hypothetical protein